MKNLGIIAIVTYVVIVGILFLIDKKRRIIKGEYYKFRGGYYRSLVFIGGGITIVLMLILKIFLP